MARHISWYFFEVWSVYYNLGDGFIPIEMQGQGLGNYYSTTLSGLYDGMIVEYYIQAVNSEGEVQTYPLDAPDNSILFILGEGNTFFSFCIRFKKSTGMFSNS